jgi:hypothetical protein
MFDKFITDYIKKGTSAEATIKDQLSQVQETSQGLEGQKKKYGVGLKSGGIVSKGQKLARIKLTKIF